MTGLKRVDSAERAATPIVDWDETKGLVKINPIATWTHDDVSHYEADRKLPIHPLFRKGYLSIGCSPTTRPGVESRGPAGGALARNRQDRMRAAPVGTPATVRDRPATRRGRGRLRGML